MIESSEIYDLLIKNPDGYISNNSNFTLNPKLKLLIIIVLTFFKNDQKYYYFHSNIFPAIN